MGSKGEFVFLKHWEFDRSVFIIHSWEHTYVDWDWDNHHSSTLCAIDSIFAPSFLALSIYQTVPCPFGTLNSNLDCCKATQPTYQPEAKQREDHQSQVQSTNSPPQRICSNMNKGPTSAPRLHDPRCNSRSGRQAPLRRPQSNCSVELRDESAWQVSRCYERNV